MQCTYNKYSIYCAQNITKGLEPISAKGEYIAHFWNLYSLAGF